MDKNNFINFYFVISDKILIYREDEIIFNLNNIFNIIEIKNIKIKSNFDTEAFWDYDDNKKYKNIKFFVSNSIYDNINIFYQNNYLEYYVEKINILNNIIKN